MNRVKREALRFTVLQLVCGKVNLLLMFGVKPTANTLFTLLGHNGA